MAERLSADIVDSIEGVKLEIEHGILLDPEVEESIEEVKEELPTLVNQGLLTKLLLKLTD